MKRQVQPRPSLDPPVCTTEGPFCSRPADLVSAFAAKSLVQRGAVLSEEFPSLQPAREDFTRPFTRLATCPAGHGEPPQVHEHEKNMHPDLCIRIMVCISRRRGEAIVSLRHSYAKYAFLHRMKSKIREVK